MRKGLTKWLREHYYLITGSIAFYPVIIALFFLLASILMLQVDFSWEGQQFKGAMKWMRLRDADTARSIVSTITAGLISLTVFSFSMVMIVLNQAASQLSNRILEKLIGNRTQQFVLGIYIGTMVYALFLLSSIRDIDSGTSIPALSIYLLILLTIIDIFVFIYFLHFITQSVKYQTIIRNIEKETREALDKEVAHTSDPAGWPAGGKSWDLPCPAAGYLQHINVPSLLKQACELDIRLEFLYARGEYLLQGIPFLAVYSQRPLSKEQTDRLLLDIDFYHGQSIGVNPMYGFRQLAEVAIKALSPGINDPSTAVLSLQALAALLAHRLRYPPPQVYCDTQGAARIFLRQYSFGELVHLCLRPVWRYGRSDQYVQEALADLLQQLMYVDREGRERAVIEALLRDVKGEKEEGADR